MIIDILTYCKDTTALIEEMLEKFPSKVTESRTLLFDKSQVLKNAEGETLALVRCNGEQYEILSQLEHLTILGSYEEVFSDPSKKEIYDRIYIREEQEYEEVDPEDNTKTIIKKYMPPEHFAQFAGG